MTSNNCVELHHFRIIPTRTGFAVFSAWRGFDAGAHAVTFLQVFATPSDALRFVEGRVINDVLLAHASRSAKFDDVMHQALHHAHVITEALRLELESPLATLSA